MNRSGTDDRSRIRRHRLPQGLFILRYASSKAPFGETPSVTVTAAGDLDFVAVPDPGSHRLRGPGDGMVIHVRRPGEVVLRVEPRYAAGSVDAELHCEPVSKLDGAPMPLLGAGGGAGTSAPPIGDALEGIQILAHVARRGDIVVPSGEWICGPSDPLPIEGLELRWPTRPTGIEVLMKATVAKRDINIPESLTGEFVGTRGRGASITGLAIKLCGGRAGDLALRAETLFRGSAVQKQTGSALSLAGPTGFEPLVGLRLEVLPASAVQREDIPAIARVPTPRPGGGLPASGRVRVFRGMKQRTGPVDAGRERA